MLQIFFGGAFGPSYHGLKGGTTKETSKRLLLPLQAKD